MEQHTKKNFFFFFGVPVGKANRLSSDSEMIMVPVYHISKNTFYTMNLLNKRHTFDNETQRTRYQTGFESDN